MKFTGAQLTIIITTAILVTGILLFYGRLNIPADIAREAWVSLFAFAAGALGVKRPGDRSVRDDLRVPPAPRTPSINAASTLPSPPPERGFIRHEVLILLFALVVTGVFAQACAEWLKPSCQVIKAANAACIAVEVPGPDGGTETVRMTGEELAGAARRVAAERR